MKHLPFCIGIIIWFTCSCKTSFYEVEKYNSNATIIKKGKIESVIFSKSAECFLCDLGLDRFSPTIEEINHAEEILARNIQTSNQPLNNQGDDCPIIHNHLKNYKRQYYGYVDNEGNKILYVNFIWAKYSIFDRLKGYHKDESENWKTERIIVLDGCSRYWNIDINLSQQKLQNLGINGPA